MPTRVTQSLEPWLDGMWAYSTAKTLDLPSMVTHSGDYSGSTKENWTDASSVTWKASAIQGLTLEKLMASSWWDSPLVVEKDWSSVND